MKSSIRTLLALIAVLALALGAAACGDDDEGSSSGGGGDNASTQAETESKAIQKDEANSGKTFTVGSKNFAEQYILGEIYAQSLEAAGFTVKKQLDLGSEQVAFKSLKDGKIDAYPEYTGTALTSFYRVKTDDVPREPQEAFDQLSSELEGDKITVGMEERPLAGPSTPAEMAE